MSQKRKANHTGWRKLSTSWNSSELTRELCSWVLSMLRESKECWEMQSPGPLDEVRQMLEKLESVERVTGDFCKSPHDDKQKHALFILNLSADSTPREKETQVWKMVYRRDMRIWFPSGHTDLSDAVGDEPNHEYPRGHLDPGHDHRCPNDSCEIKTTREKIRTRNSSENYSA